VIQAGRDSYNAAMPEHPPQPACPECGAPLSAGQKMCWLCWTKVIDKDVNPYSSPRPPADNTVGFQFSIATLFLITTLAAVCLGVFSLSPGLGILVSVVAMPALVRTMIATRYRKQAGQRPALITKVFEFIVSATTITVAVIAGIIAFAAVCTTASIGGGAVSKSNVGIAIGVGAGAIAGIWIALWLLWRTRPPYW